MKRREITQRIKVGIFVIIALVLITSLIFYIGSNQQLFGKKKQIEAIFKDVSGLKKGNAVRFSGVIIGKVEKIQILGDSSIQVSLGIDEEAVAFIKKNSRASISTEGLLGSKYIKLSAGTENVAQIQTGDTIKTEENMEMDQLFQTLNETGKKAKDIMQNLDDITKNTKNGNGTIGALMTKDNVYNNIDQMMSTFNSTSKNTQKITSKMIDMVDTLQTASRSTAAATKNLNELTNKLNSDSSTLGKVIGDTAMGKQVDQTLKHLDEAASDVTVTSTKVRESWLLKLFSKKNKCKKGEVC